MRWMFLSIAGVLTAALASADDAKKDAEQLQGTWKVVKIVEAGRKQPPSDRMKGMRYIIKGETMTAKEGDEEHRMPFKIDPTKDPKAIDLTTPGGSHVYKIIVTKDGKTVDEKVGDPEETKHTTRGIYRIDGDKLALCCPRGDDAQRPTTFTPQVGSPVNVIHLERVKE